MSTFKLCACVCVHDDIAFLAAALKSLPGVSILAAISKVDWNGQAGNWKDPQRVAKAAGATIHLGEWTSEEQHRELTRLRPIVKVDTSKELRVGVPIKLSAGVENTGPASSYLDGRLVYKVHLLLSVKDQSGKEVPYPGSNTKIKIAPPVREDYIRLDPGMSLVREDLTSGRLILRNPGLYTITLRLSHGSSESGATKFGITLGRLGGPVRLKIRVSQ